MAKEREFKSITAELKATEEGVFEGYAAFFNNKDSYSDVIVPGAFNETVSRDKSNIKLMWNHDWDDVPIGNIEEMYEDSLGLYVKCRLNNTSKALDVKEGIKTKSITKMSIGYKCVDWEYKEEEGSTIRYIKKLKLFEVSPVNFPANDMASIMGYKSGSKEELKAIVKEVIEELAKSQKEQEELKAIDELLSKVEAITNKIK